MATLDKVEAFLKRQSKKFPTAASFLASLGTPSTSVAIVEDGVVSAKCFSTVGDGAETVFQACSISKPITALAILKLVESGHLALDNCLNDLLPHDIVDGLAIDERGLITEPRRAMARGITVRQLMSHTSGLSQHGFTGYSVIKPDAVIPSPVQVLGGGFPVNSLPVRLQTPPGHCYSYSGGGITVLQLILEKATGKDFSRLMSDLVLVPLGMTRSFYGRLPETEKRSARAYYNGYTPCEDAQRALPEQAAAALWTTPTDLLKAVSAVQVSLDGSDGAFLKRETAEEMLTAVKGSMGLSWFVPEKDGRMFCHSGSNDPGFQCYTLGFADLDKTGDKRIPRHDSIAAMTNSSEGMTVMFKLMQYIALLKGWPRLTVTGALNPLRVPFSLSFDDLDAGKESWKLWKGTWHEKADTTGAGAEQGANKDEQSLALDEEVSSSQPIVRFGGYDALRLFPAAAPEAKSAEGEWRRFVVESMALTIELCEKDSEKEVKLINFADGSIKTLVRSS